MRVNWKTLSIPCLFFITIFSSHAADFLGQYHGISIYAAKEQGDGDDLVIKLEKPDRILIAAHERPDLFKVEDINNDKVLEMWALSYWGEELTTTLYQVDIRQIQKASGKAIIIKPSLTINSDSTDPFENINMKDIDDDGLVELLVAKPTHPLYGTLYSPGEVYWTDIYQLTPVAKLANSKYKKFYFDLGAQIEQEEQRIRSRINELNKAIQNEGENSDLKTILEIKVREAEDQISVYRAWLQQIKKIGMQ